MTDKEAEHAIYCGPCTCGYLEETIDSLRAELRRQSQELERAREAIGEARSVFAANGEAKALGEWNWPYLVKRMDRALAQPAQKQGVDRG